MVKINRIAAIAVFLLLQSCCSKDIYFTVNYKGHDYDCKRFVRTFYFEHSDDCTCRKKTNN